MIKYVIFDVETTGLSITDEIIQFSAIVMNGDFTTERLINFYCDTQVPISANAFNVHRIDKAKLYRLSEQKSFEDNWLGFADSLKNQQVAWIDWSRGGFDERMVNQTLVNNGLDDYFNYPRYKSLEECLKNKSSTFDLMGALCHKIGRRNMKLADAVNTLPYSKQQINYVYDKVTDSLPNKDMEMMYHNAMYDTFVTFLVFKYYFCVVG